MNDDYEELLGLKRGESIPMERHGEMGVLHRPVVQLSMDDLCLYSRVWQAWGERDLGTRENVLKLVHKVAKETIADIETRPVMVANVMAYIDELAMIRCADAKPN